MLLDYLGCIVELVCMGRGVADSGLIFVRPNYPDYGACLALSSMRVAVPALLCSSAYRKLLLCIYLLNCHAGDGSQAAH